MSDVRQIAEQVSWPDLVRGLREQMPGCAEITVEKLYTLKPDEAELRQRIIEISPAFDSVTTAVIILRLLDLGELLGEECWAVTHVLPLIEEQVQPEAAEIIRTFGARMLTRFPAGGAH